MDSNYIERHLVIDRYLQGSLDDGELEGFEERLVWDEVLVEEVRLAERLREALRGSVAEDRYTLQAAGVGARLSNLLTVPRYAAAASFLMAVLVTTAVLRVPQLAGTGPADAVPAITRVARLEVTRGEELPSVGVDENALLVLLVDAPSYGSGGAFASYRITVRSGETDILTRDGLVPTYEDSLAVTLTGEQLAPGQYVLRLEGATRTDNDELSYEVIQDIPFEASPAE